MTMLKKKLLISTTSPLTINFILKNQPKYLANFYDVELVTSPDDTFEDIALREGVVTHPLKMSRGIDPIKDFLAILKMVWLIKKVRPDIIHSYTPKAGLVTMAAALICRVPLRVHTFTGLVFPTQKGLKRLTLKLIDKFICFCSTNIVPESNGVKNILSKQNVTKKPLVLIGSGNIAGVDIDYFNPKLFPKVKFSNKNIRFLFVGRLHCDKGIKELVHAFSNLSGNVELTLVGDFDEEGSLDEQTLKQIKNNPKIKSVGFQYDIRPFLVNASVLILPSYREGFPNVLLQAGAMAIPCLVTDIPGSNEIIEQNKNGWIIPPKDSAALQEAMEKCMILSNNELDAMGLYAKAKVVELFEKKSHWSRMNDFYRGLLINEKNI